MPLQPLRLTTDDTAVAEQFLRKGFSRVESLELGPGFSLEVNGVRGDGFTVMRLSHTSTLRLSTGLSSDVHVLEMLRGSARLLSRGAETTLRPGHVLAVDSGTGLRMAGDRVTVGIVSLSRELLADVAGVPSNRLVLRSSAPVSEEWAAHWRATVRHTNREVLARPQVASQPRLVAESVRVLAMAALSTFPHEVADVAGESGPGAVQRATAYIDQHADQPLTVAEIARAARTSVRALQQAFARHHETSPTAYLRRVRLEGAHRDLMAADPTNGVTVAEVAARWGFAQPGRFAAHYREAYGCLPSDDLRSQPTR